MTDLRLAIRSLRATPVVSAVAILSPALGIGANTAIFSLVNSLLLRALPVKEPQQLALITDDPSKGINAWTNPIWEQVRQRRHEIFDDAFAWGGSRFNLAEGHAPPRRGLAPVTRRCASGTNGRSSRSRSSSRSCC